MEREKPINLFFFSFFLFHNRCFTCSSKSNSSWSSKDEIVGGRKREEKRKGGRESGWQRRSESLASLYLGRLPLTGFCPLGTGSTSSHLTCPAVLGSCKHSPLLAGIPHQEGRGNQAHPSNIFILLLS